MRKESISWTHSLGPGGGFRRRAAATHGLGPKTRNRSVRAGVLSFHLLVPAPVIWRAFGTAVTRSLLSEPDADDVIAPQLPGAGGIRSVARSKPRRRSPVGWCIGSPRPRWLATVPRPVRRPPCSARGQ